MYDYPGGKDTNYVYQNADTVSFVAKAGNYIHIVRQYITPFKLGNTWQYSTGSVNNVVVDSLHTIVIGPYQFENTAHINGRPGRPDEIISVDEWVADYAGIVKRYVDASGTNNPYKHRTFWSLVSYHIE